MIKFEELIYVLVFINDVYRLYARLGLLAITESLKYRKLLTNIYKPTITA